MIKLYSNYSSGYSFRAECRISQKDWNNATDDIISALAIDQDDKAFALMQTDDEEFFRMMKAKLKIQAAKSPNETKWLYDLGIIHESKKQYVTAIDYYKKVHELDANSVTAERISDCYSYMGAMKAALEYIDIAQQLDSTDYSLIYSKADILYSDGQADNAVIEMGRYIAKYPDYFGGYYRRGFYLDNTNKTNEALDDYTMAITIAPTFAYSYLGRGDQYMKLGNEDLAKADYRKVIELDAVPSTASCAQYAFLALGEKDKAVAFNDSILTKHPEDYGAYYDAVCLYARMGETVRAVAYLRQAFEKGYRVFTHIALDDDMDSLRDNPEFISLLNEYKDKFALECGEMEKEASESGEEETIEIPFTKEPGSNMCNVKCTINGLPLHFIFDTGASDVSLSQVEATFMMKNGYLDKNDVTGSEYFCDAVGNVNVGTTLNLRNVDFGGLTLNNVKASVVRNQKAPLLLGQSVFNRLGKIEIDNGKRVIKVTYRKK